MIYNRDIHESIKDLDFADQFLDRLVSDCDYVLNSYMNTHEKGHCKSISVLLTHLWAQNIDEQIYLMKSCKKTLDKYGIKSKISNEDINNYESELKKIENFNGPISSFQTLKKEIRELYEDMKEFYLNDFDYFDTDEINYFRHKLKTSNKLELIEIIKDILNEIDYDIQYEEGKFGESDHNLIGYRDNFEEIKNNLYRL